MAAFLTTIFLPALAYGLALPSSIDTRQTAPFSQQVAAWDTGSVSQYLIHSSCNATQRHMIATGLNETIELAEHARDHVLRWGNNSEMYRKYFGDRPTFEVVGAYETVVSGDKGSVLFRCDDPDDNCKLPGKYTYVLGVTNLTASRLGRSLARFQCNGRDCHMRSLIQNTSSSVPDVYAWVHCCWRSSEHFLGIGSSASTVSHATNRSRLD